MATHLKGLLGKTGRPMLVNGKMLMRDHKVIYARKAVNAPIEFYHMSGNEVVFLEDGEALIKERLEEFDNKYAVTLGRTPQAYEDVDVTIEPFTGAVLVETETYKALLDEKEHEQGTQHTKQVEQALREFVIEYTMNYLDSYLYLFNRKLSAQFMPINVRAHFVAGLHQPIEIGTKRIPSPFLFKEHQWFRQLLGEREIFLEKSTDSPRQLTISCASIYDICALFGAPLQRELDRKVFMTMLNLTLLRALDTQASESPESSIVGIQSKAHGRLVKAADVNQTPTAQQRLTMMEDEIIYRSAKSPRLLATAMLMRAAQIQSQGRIAI